MTFAVFLMTPKILDPIIFRFGNSLLVMSQAYG